ncbi:hypothetical protein BJ166DRAFT_590259 [Pestalotiopsis sp. NC0098]|nr:hypothetical protein BJ166DRAFT_590259 [Pestalotiopsis sp. NC0098]
MKFLLAISLLSLSSFVVAQSGPCYNHADPDNNIGNYCECEGDGLCYFDSPDTGCDPPESGSIPCP